MDLSYTIVFYSEWHCGSGLSAGADLDALVVKDANGLPFVPGKTLKGLIREAVEYILYFEGGGQITEDKSALFIKAFGSSEDKAYNLATTEPTEDRIKKGKMFFTNAELDSAIQQCILQEDLGKYIYRFVSSTAIENGTAKEHSLRRMETVIPCTLKAQILGVPEEFKDSIINGLKYIKRLGQNRNRGLGRCDLKVEEV